MYDTARQPFTGGAGATPLSAALLWMMFGLGEWQARLWTGVCGIVGVVMTAWAGREVFSPRVGLYAGLVLASTLFWLASGQIDSLDMSLSGMPATCLAAVLIAQRDGATIGQRRAWMLVAWAAMALAVLAKGLVGVVLPGTALLPAIRAELTPSTKLYAVGRYEQSLTFYLGRPAILVDHVDEFAFGLQQEPQLALSGLDGFVELWRRDAAAGLPSMAIASPALYDRLRQRGVPMRLVARDGRRLAISNQLSRRAFR